LHLVLTELLAGDIVGPPRLLGVVDEHGAGLALADLVGTAEALGGGGREGAHLPQHQLAVGVGGRADRQTQDGGVGHDVAGVAREEGADGDDGPALRRDGARGGGQARTVTRAGLCGETLRATIVGSAITSAEPATTGSTESSGMAPWAPLPWSSISQLSTAAIVSPGVK